MHDYLRHTEGGCLSREYSNDNITYHTANSTQLSRLKTPFYYLYMSTLSTHLNYNYVYLHVHIYIYYNNTDRENVKKWLDFTSTTEATPR